MSYDDLKQYLGVSHLNLWSCPSCGPSILPTTVAPSPHYSWGVILLCGICNCSWLVCKEYCNVRVHFITAGDCLLHRCPKHHLHDVSMATACTGCTNEIVPLSGNLRAVGHGNVSLPSWTSAINQPSLPMAAANVVTTLLAIVYIPDR